MFLYVRVAFVLLVVLCVLRVVLDCGAFCILYGVSLLVVFIVLVLVCAL